ncbi:MAG: hypothetical protein WC686_05775 [Candidatus Shapirobacteria bacterium]|jgi:hypothetical protein
MSIDETGITSLIYDPPAKAGALASAGRFMKHDSGIISKLFRQRRPPEAGRVRNNSLDSGKLIYEI